MEFRIPFPVHGRDGAGGVRDPGNVLGSPCYPQSDMRCHHILPPTPPPGLAPTTSTERHTLAQRVTQTPEKVEQRRDASRCAQRWSLVRLPTWHTAGPRAQSLRKRMSLPFSLSLKHTDTTPCLLSFTHSANPCRQPSGNATDTYITHISHVWRRWLPPTQWGVQWSPRTPLRDSNPLPCLRWRWIRMTSQKQLGDIKEGKAASHPDTRRAPVSLCQTAL